MQTPSKAVGILTLAPDDWAPPWTVRHHVVRHLASYFATVWMSPAPGWRNAWFGGQHGSVSSHPAAGCATSVTVYRPGRWTPQLYRPATASRLTERLRLQAARKLLRSAGCEKVVLYLWRPEHESTLDLLDYDLSCYHIDDEYTFSESERPIPAQELSLLRRVDQVFIHSTALMEKKGGINPHTMRVANGVDYEAYATPVEEPADLAAISRPRVGYVGVVKQQLDFGLLGELADLCPAWSIVLVGPVGHLGAQAESYRALLGRPNVHVLGARALEALPAYVQHMDVCALCYRINDYTKFIYPAKLHEYLASGRPVVGTPINSVLEFREIVGVAGTADGWRDAIGAALAEDRWSSARVRRQAVARTHDWARLVRGIATTIANRLGVEVPATASLTAAARSGLDPDS